MTFLFLKKPIFFTFIKFQEVIAVSCYQETNIKTHKTTLSTITFESQVLQKLLLLIQRMFLQDL